MSQDTYNEILSYLEGYHGLATKRDEIMSALRDLKGKYPGVTGLLENQLESLGVELNNLANEIYANWRKL